MSEKLMRKSHLQVALMGVMTCASAGCGTLHNLDAPSKLSEPRAAFAGPGTCVPFGGVARSGLLGWAGVTIGPWAVIDGDWELLKGNASDGFEKIGNGLWLTGVGLVSLADTPVSLAADFVTWPIAHAREQQHPWATWWGSENDVCWLHAPFSRKAQHEESASPDGRQP
jgi:hypothetical protein